MDISTLTRYERDGLIASKKHPSSDLWIWNYTDHTVFKKKWDEITLKCRSLVTDGVGNIVARSFDKFFNWYDAPARTILKEREGEQFQVFKKYDGSLILVFWYKDSLIVASRASFQSMHGNLAREIIDDTVRTQSASYDELFDKNSTYVFELIHPRTNVVINYRQRKELILLAVFDRHQERRGVSVRGFPSAETVEADTIENLMERNVPNEEGYVLVFGDGTRIKAKFQTYTLLNRHKTDLSPAHIGKLYATGTLESVVNNIPDEFFDEFQGVWDRFVAIENTIVKIFEANRNEAFDRRTFALNHRKHPYFKTLMKMHLGKPYKNDLVSYYDYFPGDR